MRHPLVPFLFIFQWPAVVLLWLCSTRPAVLVTSVMCNTHILYLLRLFSNVMCVFGAFYLLAPAVLRFLHQRVGVVCFVG
jgi:hypothetical protein